MRRLRTVTPFALLLMAGLGTAACSAAPDPFCVALDQIITSGKDATPFTEVTKGVKAAQLLSGFPPPSDLKGALGCTLERHAGKYRYACRWLTQTKETAMQSSPVADRVNACLAPKGWVRREEIADAEYDIKVSEFRFLAARVDVGVIFNAVGNLLTEELVLYAPGK